MDITDEQIISYTERVDPVDGYLSVERAAYLAGMVLGDGSKRSSKQVSLCIAREFDAKILGCLPAYHLKSKSSSSKVDIYTFYGMDVDAWLKPTKRIPDYVISEWTVNQKLWLLAGLLDTDGTLENGKVAVFQNTNKELVHQVALLCHTLGMRTQLKSKQPGGIVTGKHSNFSIFQ